MVVELSPASYMALIALVREELQTDSDATPLLQRVADELARAIANDIIPEDLAELPERVEALRRAGFGGQA